MVNGLSGMSGFGEVQRAILNVIITPLTRLGTLTARFKPQKTGTMVKKMVSGHGGIKMDISIVLENMKRI